MKFIFLTFILLLQSCVNIANVWHVDVNKGKDSNSGFTKEKSFKTIQHAVDLTRPGDTIIIYQGVYFENIKITTSGTKALPIKIMADKVENGHVIITGAHKKIRKGILKWKLVDPELQMYSIPLDYKPVRVLADNIDLLPYPTLNDLKAFKFHKNNYPGYEHGFAWSEPEKKLYLRIRSDLKYNHSVNPNELIIAVAPPTGGGKFGNLKNNFDNFNISLLMNESANVIIQGITFETPGIGGVYIKASNVTIRDNWFYGCRTGVAGNRSDKIIESRSDNIIVEYNYFTQFPTYTDAEDLIISGKYNLKSKNKAHHDIFHWQRKGNFPVGGGVGRHYAYEVGFVMNMGENWIIRNNHLFEVFEGISASANHHSKNTLITNNIFERINDNGVETENHAKNMMISNNIFIDVYEDISWQPLNVINLPGPVYIFNNIMYQSVKATKIWEITKNWSGSFKFGTKNKYWNKEYSKYQNIDVPGGLWIIHNTIVKPRGRLITYLNDPKWPLSNIHFLYNDITTWRTSTSESLGEIHFDFNTVNSNSLGKSFGYTNNTRVAGINGIEVLPSPQFRNLLKIKKTIKHNALNLLNIKGLPEKARLHLKSDIKTDFVVGPQFDM
jgi:hypothetical protein